MRWFTSIFPTKQLSDLCFLSFVSVLSPPGFPDIVNILTSVQRPDKLPLMIPLKKKYQIDCNYDPSEVKYGHKGDIYDRVWDKYSQKLQRLQKSSEEDHKCKNRPKRLKCRFSKKQQFWCKMFWTPYLRGDNEEFKGDLSKDNRFQNSREQQEWTFSKEIAVLIFFQG